MNVLTATRNISALPGAAATLFVLTTSISSAQPDTSQWECSFCPFESGYRADYEVGASSVSDDAARFGNASGYDEDGGYLNVDGEGAFANEGYRAKWLVEDLGLDSRFLEFEGSQQGRYDYRLAFRQLPQRVFDTTRSVFLESARDTLSLPSGWVRAPSTSGFSALNSSLVDRDIESDREILEIGGRYLPSSRYQVSAEYRHQTRDGVDVAGGSFFAQSSLLPRPLDYETDEFDLGLRYSGDSLQLKLAYHASVFENNNLALNWQNPFTSAPGAEFGRQAQAPDNSFHQVSLSGSYRFSAYDTVLAFSGASGRIEQDDDLLPYTSNPTLATGSLPRNRLDAEVQTTNLGVTLTARPSDRTRVRASYRSDERDNRTPVASWTPVIADLFVSGQSETNTPYSFERSQLKLSGDFDLRPTIRLSAGYERTDRDRDFQEVAEQTEETGWAKLRWRPNASVSVDVKGGTEEREVDRYNEAVAIALGQNPLLRKYHMAYRFREFGELRVTAALPESPVSITGSVMYANDDYTQSLLGLTEGEDVRVAADLSWAVSENTSVYVFGSYEDIEAQQTGSEQFSTVDWRAANEDTFLSAGVGLHLRGISDNIDLDLDYSRSDGSTEINVSSASGGSSQFPDLDSELNSLRMRLTWRRTERQEINFRLRYERFEADDWALQGVGPDTIPEILTLGAKPYDYDVVSVGLGFRYFIGERTLALRGR